jgi:hypothetical protein
MGHESRYPPTVPMDEGDSRVPRQAHKAKKTKGTTNAEEGLLVAYCALSWLLGSCVAESQLAF